MAERWDAWTETAQEWIPVVKASDYDALVARLAEAEAAILTLYEAQVRNGVRDGMVSVNAKIWHEVAGKFQHVINPPANRAADNASARETESRE